MKARQDYLLENLRGICACKPGEHCTVCLAADRLERAAIILEQRNELLAALKRINALPSELAGDAWAIARTAIAKAEAK